MITVPVHPQDTFHKKSYSDFIAELGGFRGLTLENLGVSSDETMDVYGVSITTGTNLPYVFIIGGIHGQHEWTNPYWIKTFAKYLGHPASSYAPSLFMHLRATFNFYIIPILNPWGYENGPDVQGSRERPNTRYNANGVDLNRNFDFAWHETQSAYKGPFPFSENETSYVRDKVLQTSPVLFMDWHTWGGTGRTSKFAARPPGHRCYNLLHEHMAMGFRVSTDTRWILEAFSQGRPTAGDWAGHQSNVRGGDFTTISLTPEIGADYSLGEQMSLGVTANLIFCLMAASYLKRGVLRPRSV